MSIGMPKLFVQWFYCSVDNFIRDSIQLDKKKASVVPKLL